MANELNNSEDNAEYKEKTENNDYGDQDHRKALQ
jgi:hypothetical protein